MNVNEVLCCHCTQISIYMNSILLWKAWFITGECIKAAVYLRLKAIFTSHMFSITEECLFWWSLHIFSYTWLKRMTLSAGIRTKSWAAPGLYHGPGVWLFICLVHQRLALTQLCPVRTSEKTSPGPSSLTGQASHCVTEMICSEFPCNVIVNLKPLCQRKRQVNGSRNICA